MKVIFDIYKNEYTKVFEVADYEFEIKMEKTKRRIQYGGRVLPKKYQIWSKLGILEFSRSLITNLKSKT